MFVPSDETTFTIDPAEIDMAITPRTVGIIPVHSYGQPADMGDIRRLSVEDCTLARHKGQLQKMFETVAG